MKTTSTGALAAIVLAGGLNLVALNAQAPSGTVDSHVAAARAAAGQDHVGLFNRLCQPEPARPAQAATTATPATPPRPPGPPARSTWEADAVKVFDNLYFVGEKEYSAWAVGGSGGLIILDTIFEYSVDSQIVGGLKKLGLDPATIKYALVSHGHRDHSGGAQFLQDSFKTRVLLSAADWDMLEKNTRDPSKPKRDMVVTDGQVLTLGDQSLTFYITPGHTMGTVSTIVPVFDRGTRHVAAAWGGTAFNFPHSKERFQIYIDSARRFSDIAVKAGADVLIANHTIFDGSKTKLPAMATRKAGEPHPYVIGTDSVRRYLKVAEECAIAGMMRLP
jgi:metallo-beta-lactamase class B